jgi:hypothetical protein
MADIATVATRRKDLADLARRQPQGDDGFQAQVNQKAGREPPKSFEERAYERLLWRFDDAERETLDRLIEKMMRQPKVSS